MSALSVIQRNTENNISKSRKPEGQNAFFDEQRERYWYL